MRRLVLITRPSEETAELSRHLAGSGFELLPYPVLRETSYEDSRGWEEVERSLENLACLAFTSRRAAPAFKREAKARGLWRRLRMLPAAAVGPATATTVREARLAVLVEGASGGEQLGRALGRRFQAGSLVLHPCGREHREELAEALALAGLRLLPLGVYAMDETPIEELPTLSESPCAVVLTSPRAARAYLAGTGGRTLAARHLAFGPTTARAAAALGINAVALAQPTAACILEDLCQTCC